MFLSQHTYILDLLKRTNMSEAKEVTTSLLSTTSLSLYDGFAPIDPRLYRRVVGALQYPLFTRPDIFFVVNKLSQFMHNYPLFIRVLLSIYFAT